MSRIGKRMLFWIIVLVIIPLLLISLIVYYRGRQIIREQIYVTLRVTADSVETQLLELINNKKNRINDFSSDGFIRERLKEINKLPGRPDLVNQLNRHLTKNKKPLDNDILDIFIFDNEGRPVSGTNEEWLKKGNIEPEYFLNGRKGTGVGPVESRYAERHFGVSAPLTDVSTGDFLGVITVLYKASTVDDILTGKTAMLHGARTVFGNVTDRVRISVVNKDATVVSASVPELIGRRLGTEIIKRTLAGEAVTGEYTGVLGDRRVGASMYIKEPGWAVVVSFSEREMLAPLNHLTMTVLPFIFGGVIVIITVTGTFTRSITRRAQEAAKAAKRIAHGNFSERIHVNGHDDEFTQFAVSFNGMAEKLKHREERITRLNRFYSVISRINETIVFTRDIEKIYGESCRIAVEEGLFRMAWIGLVEPLAGLVKPAVNWGFEEGYLDVLRISTEDVPKGRGPTGTAIREGRHVVCNDIEKDPRMHPWREEALKRGYRSSASFPLRMGPDVIGAFNLYANETNFFDDENVALLDQMAKDISYAIEFIEKEKQAKRSDDELHLLQSLALSINDAKDFLSAIQVALKRICESFGWVCGEAWIPDGNGTELEYGTAWYEKRSNVEKFIDFSRTLKFKPGIALPGWVWQSKKPEWVKDVSVNHSTFLRTPPAMEAGLKAGFAVPIIVDDNVVAVLVFYMAEVREEDHHFIDIVSAVSAQLSSVVRHKLSEDALRKSESKYRILTENLPQRIFLKDKNSVYVSCNENYARDLKIKPDAIIGMTDYDLHPKELAERYRAGDRAVMESGIITDIEESYVHDNQEFFVHTIKVPIKDELGDITGVLGIFWDITTQKLAEEEKVKLEEQLKHMQKMEAIGQLTGGIAHDFNNILTAIIGNSYLIEKRIDKDTFLKPFVEQLLATSERASNLTKGLLAFGRRQILDVKPAAINDIIKRVQKLLIRLIGEDIEFKTELTGEDVRIMADFGQIEQVLMNLATNARDAMPEGGFLSIKTEVVTLDNGFIKTHGYGKPGRYALISVTDMGIGMDEETKKRIFEPFFTTKELGKGTGLGLSIVYGIIKQHNGYINVYSEPGKGTTFRVYLPVVEAEIEGIEPGEALVAAGGHETVLLAEDERDVRSLTKTLLEESGYKVIEAVDGDDAIRRFTENRDRVQLLILDVIMPRKNGREAYNVIRNIRADIKTIFTSGYNEEIIHKSGIIEDGLNFISKPFVPIEFLKIVREVLDK